MNKSEYVNRYYKNELNKLRSFFGNRCNNPLCQSTDKLEFAHINPTKLNGEGRGRNNRIRDIKNNLTSYIYLCKGCHIEFDRC